MNLNPFFTTWPSIAAAVADHIWQSTVVLIVIGLLTLLLRNNRAETRYRLWMIASVKFLFPFAILTSLGSHLAMLSGKFVKDNSDLYISMEQASQPFTHSAMALNPPAERHAIYLSFIHLLPTIVLAVWLCGIAAILVMWYLRWRQISAAIRDATILEKGREVEALRELEHMGGIRKPVKLLLSRSSLEPGIFGIFRPVLVWPAEISERLSDAQLRAVLAHEVWHVRRRDNLTAAIHMAIEAIFWFHPLVWWLGARLVEERERACDDATLHCGSEPQAYAEGILNVCKFYTEAPLACVSGVTGGSLKKRMVRIMTKSFASNLSASKKILLTGIGVAFIAGPIIFGLMKTPQAYALSSRSTADPTPAFEVISIKPSHSGVGPSSADYDAHNGKLVITNATTKSIIEFAYDLRGFQLSGGPDWSGSERYDIEIQENPLPASLSKSPYGHQQGERRVLQSLLTDHFHLKLREETKTMPIYALVQGPGDLKISREKIPEGTRPVHYNVDDQDGTLKMQGVSTADLTEALTEDLSQIVVDKTRLKGFYDLTLAWTPHNNDSLITAVQDQLGLRLEPETGPVPTFVIEHVEKPAEK